MSVIAAVLADEDFHKGAAVIGIVLLGALVIIGGEIAIRRWFPSLNYEHPRDAPNAAGIDILAEQGDYIPDLRHAPSTNGCGCDDCTNTAACARQQRDHRKPLPYRPRWKPTDAEIEQFLTEAQNGGDPR